MRDGTISIKKLLGYGALLINVIVGLWLILCFGASSISPLRFKFLQLFSLTTPLAIIANFIFIFIWLFTNTKWRALFPFLLLVLCNRIIAPVFGFNYLSKNNEVRQNNTLKLIQWNVHGMGYFDEQHNHNANDIMDVINKEAPDIICLPEYYTLKNDSLKPFTSRLLADNGFPNFVFCQDNPYEFVNFGIAVFSKYPIRNTKTYNIDNHIVLIHCDIALPSAKGEKIVSMFFTHLCSFLFTNDDKDLLLSFTKKINIDEKDVWRSKAFINKFNRDYCLRANEAEVISAIINQTPYPVLVCGDFNDLPASYAYTVLKGSLNDAFIQKGFGFGRTYNRIFPTLRIDHIFYDPTALHLLSYRTLKLQLSDHYPIIANFEIDTHRW